LPEQYERLNALSGHVKVWISYELFDTEAMPLPRAEQELKTRETRKKTRMRRRRFLENGHLLGRCLRG